MKKILFPLAALIFLFSCQDTDDTLDECAAVTMCTLEFRTIGAKLHFPSENQSRPDSIFTIHKGLNKTYHFEEEFYLNDHQNVIVITDSQMADIDKDGSELELVIIHQNQELARELFLVGHDCCHVEKLSGSTELTLNL